MKYLFYEHGELVAELDKCTVVSAADDAGVSTVLLNGKTYQRRKPVEFVQEWVAFDLVNKWASAPFQSFEEVNKAAAGWFDKVPKGLNYHIGNAAEFWMKECHNWRDAFERLESDVERLRGDKIVANGLIANLEGLAAADGEKIRDLESKLETIAASRERSIDDYNKSVAREGRLREEIQRINLRLADAEHERVRALAVESELRARLAEAEHQRDCLLAKVEKYENGHHPHDDCGARIAELRYEVDVALKDRDQWRAEAQGLRKVVDERNKALDAAVKRADGLLVNLRSVKQMVAGIE